MSDSMEKILEIVITIVFTMLFVVPIGVWISKGWKLSSRNAAIRSNGIKTTAVVKEFKLGGKALGNEFYPAVELYVMVENEKGGFYSAKIETTIAVTHIPRFQPGVTVDIACDPADPAKVALLTPTK